MIKTKIFKSLIALVIVIIQLTIFGRGVNAANIGETKTLERGEKGYYCVQKWDGIKWIYLTYNQTFYTDTDGQRYIAYCLSPGKPGVGYVAGEKDGYDVKINDLLKNDVIWRVLKNGYPNKSVQELGVETTDDAYFATMQAINAILRGHTIGQARELYSPGKFAINGESFEDIQRRGNKTLNLMFKLMDIGLNGKETRNDYLQISIKNINQFQKENDIFYSQTFRVQSLAEIAEFKIEKMESLPEGSYIADEKGNKKQAFKGNEKFKVYIPRKNIIKDINGTISVKAKQKNYPIYFGASSIDGFQDYALCNNSYSDVDVSFNIGVKTDKSKLKITKVDKETQKPIEGVMFRIIFADGSNKEYFTDKNGYIELSNLRPGTVTVKEIKTVGKYELDDAERKVKLDFDDVKEIKIENKLQKGNIKIVKVDKENRNIKLSDVKFILKNEKGNIINEGTTNKEGELIFKDLVIGKYVITEKSTIKDYELLKDELNVEVANGKTKEVQIENQKLRIPEKPKVEKKTEIPKVVKNQEVPEIHKQETEKELPKTGNQYDDFKIAASMMLIGVYNICLITVKIVKKIL